MAQDAILKGVRDAIRKELPAEVGDVLRERLDLADRLEKENPKLEKKIEKLEKTADENKQLIDQLRSDVADINAKRVIMKQERDAALISAQQADQRIMEVRLEEAEKRAEFATKTTMGLVRNTEFRRQSFRDVMVPDSYSSSDSYGNPTGSTTHTKHNLVSDDTERAE